MSAPATRTISTAGSNHRFVRITARSLCQPSPWQTSLPRAAPRRPSVVINDHVRAHQPSHQELLCHLE